MEATLAIAAHLPHLREIGRIGLLQVAPCSLKRGIYPDESYHPTDLVAVQAVLLTPRGVIGVDAAGGPILDVHHADHPQARRWGADNGISLGFSAHYAAMREFFGPHLVDGVAGENLLVVSEQSWSSADLAQGLYIASQGGEELVQLAGARAATPCAPFARFASCTDALRGAAMKSALQFLHQGTRGFYVTLAAPLPVAHVRVGDRVLVPRSAP
jgi:hypothetical protein